MLLDRDQTAYCCWCIPDLCVQLDVHAFDSELDLVIVFLQFMLLLSFMLELQFLQANQLHYSFCTTCGDNLY